MSPIMRFGLVLFALVVLPLLPVFGDESAIKTAQTAKRAKPPANEPTLFAGMAGSLGPVKNLAVSPDGRLLAVGHGSPGAFSVWDLGKSKLIASFNEGKSVTGVAFSPDGKLVAYGTHGNLVRIRRTDTREIERELTVSNWSPVYVAFSPDGKAMMYVGKIANRSTMP